MSVYQFRILLKNANQQDTGANEALRNLINVIPFTDTIRASLRSYTGFTAENTTLPKANRVNFDVDHLEMPEGTDATHYATISNQFKIFARIDAQEIHENARKHIVFEPSNNTSQLSWYFNTYLTKDQLLDVFSLFLVKKLTVQNLRDICYELLINNLAYIKQEKDAGRALVYYTPDYLAVRQLLSTANSEDERKKIFSKMSSINKWNTNLHMLESSDDLKDRYQVTLLSYIYQSISAIKDCLDGNTIKNGCMDDISQFCYLLSFRSLVKFITELAYNNASNPLNGRYNQNFRIADRGMGLKSKIEYLINQHVTSPWLQYILQNSALEKDFLIDHCNRFNSTPCYSVFKAYINFVATTLAGETPEEKAKSEVRKLEQITYSRNHNIEDLPRPVHLRVEQY